MDKVAEYRNQVETARLGVPYYVKDVAAFQRSHPKGGRERCAPLFPLNLSAHTCCFPHKKSCFVLAIAVRFLHEMGMHQIGLSKVAEL